MNINKFSRSYMFTVIKICINISSKFQQLRLLKTLTITHSNIPNIGRRTMWGLSGLKTLNLSHNKLTNVIDQNFEGTIKKFN